MSDQRLVLETASAPGPALRVHFRWQRDRYGHSIQWLQAGQELVTVLQSLEGTSEEVWPASPPLQQLHMESRAAGRYAAMLVGMAGSSHWSLSVEAQLDPVGLLFDAACRTGRASEGPLGSSYRLVDCTLVRAEANRVLLRSGSFLWELTSFDPTDAPSALQLDGDIVRIVPRSSAGAGKTERWRYQVALAQPQQQVG